MKKNHDKFSDLVVKTLFMWAVSAILLLAIYGLGVD